MPDATIIDDFLKEKDKLELFGKEYLNDEDMNTASFSYLYSNGSVGFVLEILGQTITEDDYYTKELEEYINDGISEFEDVDLNVSIGPGNELNEFYGSYKENRECYEDVSPFEESAFKDLVFKLTS